jgi:enamine deaminase RidA (YjgF/YER057c/UK114 family)
MRGRAGARTLLIARRPLAAGRLQPRREHSGRSLVNTTRPPTSSLVQVAGLVRADLLIEVEAVAWVPD